MLEKYKNKAILTWDIENKSAEKPKRESKKYIAIFKVPIHFDWAVRQWRMELTKKQYEEIKDNNYIKKGMILLDNT